MDQLITNLELPENKCKFCHHQPTHNNGELCLNCIKNEWPFAIIENSEYLIVWKATWRKYGAKNLAIGFYGAPYQLSKVTAPWGLANWLLSPLGALKETRFGVNRSFWTEKERRIRIIAALAAIKHLRVVNHRKNLIIESTSPVLTVKIMDPAEFPLSAIRANGLLADVNANCLIIDELEKCLRPVIPNRISLPPPLNRQLALQVIQNVARAFRGRGTFRLWQEFETHVVSGNNSIREFVQELEPAAVVALRREAVKMAWRQRQPGGVYDPTAHYHAQ